MFINDIDTNSVGLNVALHTLINIQLILAKTDFVLFKLPKPTRAQ